MRILLIAPSHSGLLTPRLETLPEIRAIVANHHTNLLIKDVTVQDIYDAVRSSSYDVIHFAAHSDANMLRINDTETIDKEQCAQIARSANARLIFFNGCNSSGLASYAVRHGVEYAIFTSDKLEDREAWQMPNTFYNILSAPDKSIVDAYVKSDGGEGLYGLLVAPDRMADQKVFIRDLDMIKLNTAKTDRRVKYLVVAHAFIYVIFISQWIRGF